MQKITARELSIPFVASGGCADGKQLAAALSMGAEGMNMGTRFMVTDEAPIHQNVKDAILSGDEMGTTLVMRSMKNTERVYKNKAAVECQKLEQEYPGDFSKIHHLVKGSNYKKVFHETGDIDQGVWSCGPVMGLIDSQVSCKALCDSIVTEAEDIITKRLQQCVVE